MRLIVLELVTMKLATEDRVEGDDARLNLAASVALYEEGVDMTRLGRLQVAQVLLSWLMRQRV